MWAELRALAEQFAADDAVRVVVFTGAGTAAFVSGTDISEFRAFAGDGESSGDGGSRAADEGVAYEARMDGVIAALEAIPVPTIAAVGGACTGGGVSIAAACDLRIGAPSTRVGVPIARTLGNCLSLANVARVAELIGLDRVKMLLLTGGCSTPRTRCTPASSPRSPRAMTRSRRTRKQRRKRWRSWPP